MNATADAFMAIFGMKPVTCETCTHALPSVAYPMVYCPVKGKPVQKFERCKDHAERRK